MVSSGTLLTSSVRGFSDQTGDTTRPVLLGIQHDSLTCFIHRYAWLEAIAWLAAMCKL